MTTTTQNQEYVEKAIAGVLLYKPWYKNNFFFNENDFTSGMYRKIVNTIIQLPDEFDSAEKIFKKLLLADIPAMNVAVMIEESHDYGWVTISPVEYGELCKKLRENMVRRTLGEFSKTASTEELIQKANELASISEKFKEQTMSKAFSEYYDDYIAMQDKKRSGQSTFIQTGLSRFDYHVRLDKGMFMALGARTSIGKSLFALWLAVLIAQQGNKVYYLNLEMGNREIINRALGILTQKNALEFRRYDADIEEAVATLGNTTDNIILNSSAGVTTADLRSFVMSKNKIDVLVVDYINLLTDKGDSEHQRLQTIADNLKKLSLERNCAVIGCCQLNREAEKKGERPKMHHIKDSSGIEMAADVVALMHRERDENNMMLFIEKHRLGNYAEIEYMFSPDSTTYRELTP